MGKVALLPTDPGAADLQTLEEEITELAAHIHAATYRLLELIRKPPFRLGKANGWTIRWRWRGCYSGSSL